MRRGVKPYPAELARGFDLVPILGLQEALGAGDFALNYFKGKVSYQREKIPPDVRRTGKLGEGRIKILPSVRDQIEYNWGSKKPKYTDIRPQKEILEEIVEELGLERREEALGINIKERIILHKVPKKLEDFEPFQAYEYLEHLQTTAGDFTGVISRALRLPSGFLRPIPKFVRADLIDWGIVKPKEKILTRIRSILRTFTIKPLGREWLPLTDYMTDLHRELSVPYKWQDVGLPSSVVIQDGFIRPLDAQIYRLLRRKYNVAVQLPKGVF